MNDLLYLNINWALIIRAKEMWNVDATTLQDDDTVMRCC